MGTEKISIKRRKRPTEWTNEEIALARRMLAEKRPDSEFRERLGKSRAAAIARMFRASHHDAAADWSMLGLPHEPRIDVASDVLADANRRAAAPGRFQLGCAGIRHWVKVRSISGRPINEAPSPIA